VLNKVVTKALGTLGPASSSQSPSTCVIRHRSPPRAREFREYFSQEQSLFGTC